MHSDSVQILLIFIIISSILYLYNIIEFNLSSYLNLYLYLHILHDDIMYWIRILILWI